MKAGEKEFWPLNICQEIYIFLESQICPSLPRENAWVANEDCTRETLLDDDATPQNAETYCKHQLNIDRDTGDMQKLTN